jgi:hypothetical protein
MTPEGGQLLNGLAALAWKMQMGRAAAVDFGALIVIPNEQAIQALSPSLLKKALDSTIMEGTGDVRFRHQLLQDTSLPKHSAAG